MSIAQQYLPVGCYGKLPFWPEFLAEGVKISTASAFKQWLHDGKRGSQLSDLGGPAGVEAGSSTRASSKGPSPQPDSASSDPDGGIAPAYSGSSRSGDGRETAARRFLFHLPGSLELMAGVIRPSTDQGNLRHFPFVVFTHFLRSRYGRHYAFLPIGLAPVWDALEAAWDNLALSVSQSAFREVLSGTMIPAPAESGEVRTEFARFAQRGTEELFKGKPDASLDALLGNLPGVLRTIRARPERVRLELPVSDDLATTSFDAAFWIDLINRQFLLKRFEPQVFIDAGHSPKGRHVLLVFGRLGDEDYPLVLGSGGSSAGALRPAAGRAEGFPHTDLTYSEMLVRRFGG